MKRVLISVMVLTCTGCTTTSLERHTVNQALSVTDLRYQEVLNDLAAVANNPGNLPSFAAISDGTSILTDSAQVDSMTAWDLQSLKGFSKETLNAFVKRSPEQNWTLTPVVSEPLLQGLHCACLWAVYGPPPPDSNSMNLLRGQRYSEVTGYHLNVADRLSKLEPGWLSVGKCRDVPLDACYKAHCHDTWVWVTRCGLKGLSDFTLVVLDIATTDPTSLALPVPMANVKTTFVVKPKGSASASGSDSADAMNDRCTRTIAVGRTKGSGPVGDGLQSMTQASPVSQTICYADCEPIPGVITIDQPLPDRLPAIEGGQVPLVSRSQTPRFSPPNRR